MAIDRVANLAADYERLGQLLLTADGAAAAAIARERRIISELLETLEKPEEASVADQLAERRRAKSSNSRQAARG